jgi:putative transposase
MNNFSNRPQPSSRQERWAQLRFSVVGPLLSAPPSPGDLQAALEDLSRREWQHPTCEDERVRFALSTIERWYYIAKGASNPIDALRRVMRHDAGSFRIIGPRLSEALRAQHREYPHWTYQLHHDNLSALVSKDPSFGELPSYQSLLRYMKAKNLRRTKRTRNEKRAGLARSRDRLDRREVRSFEVDHVGALWHLDFHTSRFVAILGPGGEWVKPKLLAILDDRSRLCCHAQFYLEETTEILVHGLSQALLKRGLPRSLLSDNGSAMISDEYTQGLERLSILHETTLPYSPHQNGKQEHLWAVIEGRFLAMLDHATDLTLEKLNTLLQAWVEGDYHRRVHSETRQTPIDRFLEGPDVSRPAPDPSVLKEAFRRHVRRRIRRSDSTLTIDGVRCDVPAAYRHFERVRVAYARWDLGFIHLADPASGKIVVRIFPTDKSRNASGERRLLDPLAPEEEPCRPAGELPPFLKNLVEEYAASGLPPAYLSKQECHKPNDGNRINNKGKEQS